MDHSEGLRGNPYVSWDAFPAERRGGGFGRGAKKPMGVVCAWVSESDAGEGARAVIEVPSDVAKRLGSIRKGQPEDGVIRFDDLLDLIALTQRQVAKERILRLVNRRDYSRHELYERLSRDGFERDVCNEVLDGLTGCGIVSDARFAEVYVRSKISAGWGTERIVRELEKRGVDVNDLEGWPYEFIDPEAEYERAVTVARKKCSGSRTPTYQQLVRFLIGRGFSYDVARGAANMVA